MTTGTEILEPVPGLVTVIVHPGGVANVTVLNPGTNPAPPATSANFILVIAFMTPPVVF